MGKDLSHHGTRSYRVHGSMWYEMRQEKEPGHHAEKLGHDSTGHWEPEKSSEQGSPTVRLYAEITLD